MQIILFLLSYVEIRFLPCNKYFEIPSKQSILHVGRSCWSSALHVCSTHCCDSKKLLVDSLNKQERVSPSLYGHYNTIAFQCFNTNSTRCSPPHCSFSVNLKKRNAGCIGVSIIDLWSKCAICFFFTLLRSTKDTFNVYWITVSVKTYKEKEKEVWVS